MTTLSAINNDLAPIIGEAIEAHRAGDNLKASALRARVNIKLRKRGFDPMEFWGTFLEAAQSLQG